MKKILSLLVFAVFLAGQTSLPAVVSANDRAVSLNSSKTHGVWEGWGVSLCWWAKVFGDRKDVADALFTTNEVAIGGQKVPGLGLNIVRYNAGACGTNEVEGKRMAVSKNILPFRQIDTLWVDGKSDDPASSGWNWNADANQRAMLLMAKERGVDQVELFSNSPPWWMCSNLNPSGNQDGKKSNLARENYRKFAQYLAVIAAKAKKDWGITFTTVEALNEPSTDYWFANGKQEGAHFSPQEQKELLPILREELDRRGLQGMPISASDETSYSHALTTWKAFDPAAKSLVNRVNVHGYEGSKGPRVSLHDAVAADAKPVANSEYGDKRGDGLQMARCLSRDLVKLHPVSWCYWQAFDGGNNGGWGLFPADLMKGTIGNANPKYFILAQYARHIRPGMTLLETGDEDVAAALDSKGHQLVVVAVNATPPPPDPAPSPKPGALPKATPTPWPKVAAKSVMIDLSSFAPVTGPVSAWITEPFGTTRHAVCTTPFLSGNILTLPVPPESVVTVEVEGLTTR